MGLVTIMMTELQRTHFDMNHERMTVSILYIAIQYSTVILTVNFSSYWIGPTNSSRA